MLCTHASNEVCHQIPDPINHLYFVYMKVIFMSSSILSETQHSLLNSRRCNECGHGVKNQSNIVPILPILNQSFILALRTFTDKQYRLNRRPAAWGLPHSPQRMLLQTHHFGDVRAQLRSTHLQQNLQTIAADMFNSSHPETFGMTDMHAKHHRLDAYFTVSEREVLHDTQTWLLILCMTIVCTAVLTGYCIISVFKYRQQQSHQQIVSHPPISK